MKIIKEGINNKNKYDIIYATYKSKKYGFIKTLTSNFNNFVANIILKTIKGIFVKFKNFK